MDHGRELPRGGEREHPKGLLAHSGVQGLGGIYRVLSFSDFGLLGLKVFRLRGVCKVQGLRFGGFTKGSRANRAHEA